MKAFTGIKYSYKLTDDFNQYGKPTTYVEDFASAEEAKEELEFLLDTGAIEYHG